MKSWDSYATTYVVAQYHPSPLDYNYLTTKHSIKHKNTSAMYSVVAKYHMFVLNYNLTDNLTLIYMLCIGFAKQEIW